MDGPISSGCGRPPSRTAHWTRRCSPTYRCFRTVRIRWPGEYVQRRSVANSDGGLAARGADCRLAVRHLYVVIAGVLHRRQQLQPDLDLLASTGERIVTVGGVVSGSSACAAVRPPTDSDDRRGRGKVDKRKRDMETPVSPRSDSDQLRCR